MSSLARLATLFVAATGALAFPEWIPASKIPGAVRGPCPGLNTLANHGFLPRDGKNISLPVLLAACQEGLNVGADFCTVAGTLALTSKGGLAKGGLAFDLDDIDQHNYPIEHDVSFSRQDAYFGDWVGFNPSVYKTVQDTAEAGTYNIGTMAEVRRTRLQDSLKRNPELYYGVLPAVFAFQEVSITLSVMGDPVTGIAPTKFVDFWIQNEKFPYELGWTPPLVQTNLATLAIKITEIVALANDEVLEGVLITATTLKNILLQNATGLPSLPTSADS